MAGNVHLLIVVVLFLLSSRHVKREVNLMQKRFEVNCVLPASKKRGQIGQATFWNHLNQSLQQLINWCPSTDWIGNCSTEADLSPHDRKVTGFKFWASANSATPAWALYIGGRK